jgi:hypothetical protein
MNEGTDEARILAAYRPEAPRNGDGSPGRKQQVHAGDWPYPHSHEEMLQPVSG